MTTKKETTGKIIAKLRDEPKMLIGRAILGGLTSGGFRFRNPLATEGGDYDQSGGGGYTQTGGGNHNQAGPGNYNQSSLTNNLGNLDITDIAEILASVEKFDK